MANTDVLKDAMIVEDEHEKSLQSEANDSKGKLIPKGGASLEKLYDL